MNIVENMLRIFHSYCGVRSKEVLTSSQFTKLSLLPGMTSEKITRNDYHLVFIKIMRSRWNQNQMNFEDFIDALEYLVKQLIGFTEEDKLSVMQDHIDSLVASLPPEK
jgi:DNA repair protein RadC